MCHPCLRNVLLPMARNGQAAPVSLMPGRTGNSGVSATAAFKSAESANYTAGISNAQIAINRRRTSVCRVLSETQP
jgi:hypothetical protein